MPRIYTSQLPSLRSRASWCCLFPRVGDAQGSKVSVIKGVVLQNLLQVWGYLLNLSLFCVCLRISTVRASPWCRNCSESAAEHVSAHYHPLVSAVLFTLFLFFVLLQLAHNNETICMCLLRKARSRDQKMRQTGCYVVVDQLITFVQLPNGRKPPCFDSRKPSISEMW